MRIAAVATTVAIAAAALTTTPIASAESLSSLIDSGTLDALSSGVSSGDSPRLVLAKRIADERFNSLDCDEILGTNVTLKKLLSENLDYTKADTLVAAVISAGLLDEQINKTGLKGSEREEFTVFLRHVIVEKAVTCGAVSDEAGKASAFRKAQQTQESGSSSLSSGLSS